MKEHKKPGILDLNYILYIHVKEMVSNNTIYVICTEESIVRENEKGLSSSTEKIIGVIVIEKNDLFKMKVNCIIHYMRILPKYLMGKVFASDT